MPKKHVLAAYAAVAAMAVLILVVPAHSAEVDLGNPAFAQVSGRTSIPIGHAEFCKSHRAECRANATVADVAPLDERTWAELVTVNNEMNSGIVPVSDEDLYKVAELWTYPQGYGDCEDIALAKRKRLIERGWNPSTLLMTVVREESGAGHAVLMVRTDRGDLILDNQDGSIRVWSDTPYQFVKRQSQRNAGEWVGIVDDRGIVVTTASAQ